MPRSPRSPIRPSLSRSSTTTSPRLSRSSTLDGDMHMDHSDDGDAEYIATMKRRKNADAQASFRAKRKVITESLETSVDGMDLLVQDYQDIGSSLLNQNQILQSQRDTLLAMIKDLTGSTPDLGRLPIKVEHKTPPQPPQHGAWSDHGSDVKITPINQPYATSTVPISTRPLPFSRHFGSVPNIVTPNFDNNFNYGPTPRPIQGAESSVRNDLQQTFTHDRFALTGANTPIAPQARRYTDNSILIPSTTTHANELDSLHLPPYDRISRSPSSRPPSSTSSHNHSHTFTFPASSTDSEHDSATSRYSHMPPHHPLSGVNGIHYSSHAEHRRVQSEPDTYRELDSSWEDGHLPRVSSGTATLTHRDVVDYDNDFNSLTHQSTLENIKRLAQARKGNLAHAGAAKEIAYAAMHVLVESGNSRGLQPPRRWLESRKRTCKEYHFSSS